MIAEGMTLTQKIQQDILELPQESLPELEQFIEFLRFKIKPHRKKTEDEKLDTSAVRNLRGILKGYDFSPEFIAEARREMWGGKDHAESAR
jgi:hypothetical protein